MRKIMSLAVLVLVGLVNGNEIAGQAATVSVASQTATNAP
jgi:uncharacterized protein HemY